MSSLMTEVCVLLKLSKNIGSIVSRGSMSKGRRRRRTHSKGIQLKTKFNLNTSSVSSKVRPMSPNVMKLIDSSDTYKPEFDSKIKVLESYCKFYHQKFHFKIVQNDMNGSFDQNVTLNLYSPNRGAYKAMYSPTPCGRYLKKQRVVKKR